MNSNEYSLHFSVYQDCHPVLLLSFTATKSSQKKFRRLKGKISNRLVAHDSSSLLLLPPQQWHNVAAIVAAHVELCCSTLMWGISVKTSCFKCVPLLSCALERLSDPHNMPAVMETRRSRGSVCTALLLHTSSGFGCFLVWSFYIYVT